MYLNGVAMIRHVLLVGEQPGVVHEGRLRKLPNVVSVAEASSHGARHEHLGGVVPWREVCPLLSLDVEFKVYVECSLLWLISSVGVLIVACVAEDRDVEVGSRCALSVIVVEPIFVGVLHVIVDWHEMKGCRVDIVRLWDGVESVFVAATPLLEHGSLQHTALNTAAPGVDLVCVGIDGSPVSADVGVIPTEGITVPQESAVVVVWVDGEEVLDVRRFPGVERVCSSHLIRAEQENWLFEFARGIICLLGGEELVIQVVVLQNDGTTGLEHHDTRVNSTTSLHTIHSFSSGNLNV